MQDDSHLTEAQKKAKRAKKFQYRGVELEKLLDLSNESLMELFVARHRRKFSRGISRAPTTLLKKLRAAKKGVPYGEKPAAVKTHLRNMVIVPEIIGSVVGVYNGKQFLNAEIKPEMIGSYLAEYAITYKPIRHGKPGLGGSASRFIGY